MTSSAQPEPRLRSRYLSLRKNLPRARDRFRSAIMPNTVTRTSCVGGRSWKLLRRHAASFRAHLSRHSSEQRGRPQATRVGSPVVACGTQRGRRQKRGGGRFLQESAIFFATPCGTADDGRFWISHISPSPTAP